MICGGPGCQETLSEYAGVGRRPEFCSEACRKRRQRANHHVAKAAELLDQLRSIPTAVAVAALAEACDADLDRALVITARNGRTKLSVNTGTARRPGNDTDVIVTPKGETPR